MELRVSCSRISSVTENNDYRVSFFVKEKDYRYVQIAASTGFRSSSCNFDLQTGAISQPCYYNTFIA